ncbi:MAG: pyrroline-5-carboxylate reductase [Phycisphaerales bacterium]
MHTIEQPILFIGGGHMAGAILSGATAAGTLNPELVGVVDPNPDCPAGSLNAFLDAQSGFGWVKSLGLSGLGVVLAVKPQMLGEAMAPVRVMLGGFGYESTLISILAGTTIDALEKSTGGLARVVRVMPNTPAQLGLGMSAISGSARATDADLDLARRLFASVGKVIEIDEPMLDAFTAVAGSGPAYVFYLAEAMSQAAQRLGFSVSQADEIVRQTVLGAATLLDRSGEQSSVLRTRVTSTGGTTHAAMQSMEDDGVMTEIVRAIERAQQRGVELGSPANENT